MARTSPAVTLSALSITCPSARQKQHVSNSESATARQ
jgi:hypothetical protein